MVFPKPPLYLDYLKTEKENLGQLQHHEPTHVQKKRTFINLCSSPNHLPPPPSPSLGLSRLCSATFEQFFQFWATSSIFSLSEYFLFKVWI